MRRQLGEGKVDGLIGTAGVAGRRTEDSLRGFAGADHFAVATQAGDLFQQAAGAGATKKNAVQECCTALDQTGD